MGTAAREHLPVIVVGAGWAGLAAAVELARQGIPVRLLEATRQLGGRARRVRFGEQAVDNGQHLMIGAYRDTLALLQRIGVDRTRVLHRQRLALRLRDAGGLRMALRTAPLPAPLHLLAGLLTARGLSLRDRHKALRFGRRLGGLRLAPDQDISVEALLHSEQQTAALMQTLWRPLCLATLNTPSQHASARVFLRVLDEAFLHLRTHSDLLVPARDLGRVLPDPCAAFLESHRVRIDLGARVDALELRGNRVCGVRVGGQSLAARQVVIATDARNSRRLLDGVPALATLCRRLEDLGSEPVVTLYLQFPPAVRLAGGMTGLLDGHGQWLFDRRLCGQPGLMALVISGDGPHMTMPREALVDALRAQLRTCFPRWPQPLSQLLVREKHATFSCRPGIDRLRPAVRTPLRGAWLAGDYTDTGLPATLEGAVRSGHACAAQLRAEELVHCRP